MTVKVIDNFLCKEEAKIILDSWPSSDSPCWYKRSDLFQNNQFGCNNQEQYPEKIKEIICYFNSDKFIEKINSFLKINGLKKDDFIHGGGMVQYGEGGYLNLHLDYDLHPKSGLQRRANILYYLNENWKEEWGGALKIYKKNILIDKIFPKFNRLVIFSVDDDSIHGFPEPLKCPKDVFRKSINVYYVSEPKYNVAKRQRAYFLPGPMNEKGDFDNDKNWTEEDFKKRNDYLNCSKFF